MRVTYFGSDLTDPASTRRIHILRNGGADVTVIGYHRRAAAPLSEIEGCPVIDLGQTFDAKLASRAARIVLDTCKMRLLRHAVQDADVVLGRNLEMVMMAYWACKLASTSPLLVYECLDVHRAFLGNLPIARLLRCCERHILLRTDTLVVSSPGFVSNYFRKLGVRLPTVVLAENKRIIRDTLDRPHPSGLLSPPWRIGWFGKLRCIESFHILHRLAQLQPDLVDIRMRGQPLPEVQRLIDRHLPLPNMRFDGPYTQDDIAQMYGECDLTWAIEYYNRGSNSDWCLANRLYEGGYNNCPTIALSGTETAAWLKARNTGVLLREPHVDLEPFLINLTAEQYRELRRTCEDIPTSDLVWTDDDCQDFVTRIAGTRLTD